MRERKQERSRTVKGAALTLKRILATRRYFRPDVQLRAPFMGDPRNERPQPIEALS